MKRKAIFLFLALLTGNCFAEPRQPGMYIIRVVYGNHPEIVKIIKQ